MKKLVNYACVLLMLASVAPAIAQDEADSQPFLYATYMECDPSRLSEVDDLVKKMAPAYDAAVEAGDLASWGWGRHHTGGSWDRFFFGAGANLPALMDKLDALADETDEIEGADEFSKICSDHTDYVWRQVAASSVTATQNPGTAGVSQYYKCSFNDEGFADEIVKGHFAKIFDAHVAEGKLVSWTWASHVMGGEYRRLLAMRAASRANVLDTWGEIVNALGEKENGALRKFSEICFAHDDYLWMTGD